MKDIKPIQTKVDISPQETSKEVSGVKSEGQKAQIKPISLKGKKLSKARTYIKDKIKDYI